MLVTAGLLTTLLDFAHGAGAHGDTFGFLRAANLGRVVLLAHSAGGAVAMRLLSGLPAWHVWATGNFTPLHALLIMLSICVAVNLSVLLWSSKQRMSAGALQPCVLLITHM